MNDPELNDLLRQAVVPERTGEEWKEFARDTTRRIQTAQAPVPGVGRPRVWPSALVVWGVGCAAVCVLMGFLLGPWRAKRETHHDEISDARKLFLELNAMFPNQINAVILNKDGPQLILAEKPVPREFTPIFVRICGEKGCERVITFSGQHVPFRDWPCEVLMDSAGNVIVAGDKFVWTSTDRRSRAAGYEIAATQLSGAL